MVDKSIHDKKRKGDYFCLSSKWPFDLLCSGSCLFLHPPNHHGVCTGGGTADETLQIMGIFHCTHKYISFSTFSYVKGAFLLIILIDTASGFISLWAFNGNIAMLKIMVTFAYISTLQIQRT